MATTSRITSLQPTATSRDRLGFGIFLALALHASLILGLNLKPTKPLPELELTVALQPSAAATTPDQSAPAPEAKTTIMQPQQQSEPALQSMAKTEPQQPTLRNRFNRAKLIDQIANLQTQGAFRQDTSRVRRLDEPSAALPTATAEAAYLAMWRRKCERIGRVNYPPGNIQGELVMRVSILSNGQLDYVRIVRSSGSTSLDKAALNTVRQAAPYQPFSIEMRKAYDRLEFTRTWQYSKFGTDINR